MEQIIQLFNKLYPKLIYKSKDEKLKNEILIIFIVFAGVISLSCHFLARFYEITLLIYSSLFATICFCINYLFAIKGKIITAKNFYVQISNLLLFITVFVFPKETSYNILYAVLFFTIFSIYELTDQRRIFINSSLLILSYVILEICKINFFPICELNLEQSNVLFYQNMIFFSSGMVTCIYFYLGNNSHYRNELFEKEENLNAVLENSQRAIWSVDKSLKILTMNGNFVKTAKIISGLDAKIGDYAPQFLPPDYDKNLWVNLCKMALEGKNSSDELYINYQGNDIFLEINLYPILNAEKQITGIALFGRDITRRKENAKILENKTNELMKANKELDLLVYRASHDLRAPLMSILGLIKITEMEFQNTKGSINFEMMNKSIYKLDSYIQDIINFSRNARTEISVDTINFQKIVDEQIAALVYFEHSEHIEIIKEISKTAPFISDAKRLEIIFHNLISNAMKYHNINQELPFIKISIAQNEKEAIILIADNGLGIEHNHIEHIFNMFYRASTDSKGSGLGLYIVKDAVNKLKGKISLESDKGKGTIFKLTIPNNLNEIQDKAKAL